MIILKSPEEIARMEVAGRVVAETLAAIREFVRPGMTTLNLDRFAEECIRKAGAKPAFKGYRGYPYTICASVNSEVVHGLPSADRRLKEGDIIGIDLGVVVDGYYGDAAVTLPLGKVGGEALRLLRVTEESLERAIAKARAGNHLSDISHAVQSYVEAQGYSVVVDFVGHGIGRNLHEDPQVPNFGEEGKGPKLRPGMVLAIEPMVNAGGSEVEILEDQWTVVTRDGSLSAHFEHTVAITGNGPRVLTLLVG
ncbi:MAG: type I methionyl aminopeptidase [Nitrospirae bacterium]|nr:type I methionyl aminopeptidase [Nitrospirota bacterium]